MTDAIEKLPKHYDSKQKGRALAKNIFYLSFLLKKKGFNVAEYIEAMPDGHESYWYIPIWEGVACDIDCTLYIYVWPQITAPSSPILYLDMKPEFFSLSVLHGHLDITTYEILPSIQTLRTIEQIRFFPGDNVFDDNSSMFIYRLSSLNQLPSVSLHAYTEKKALDISRIFQEYYIDSSYLHELYRRDLLEYNIH